MHNQRCDNPPLGFPASRNDPFVTVDMGGDVQLAFDAVLFEWINWLFPTGRLHVHHDGHGRRYVDLRCEAGQTKRIPLARLILCLLGEPEQKNRRAHHRDKDWRNFLPENLYLGGSGPYVGSDDTWQEVARREWARANGLSPDRRAARRIGDVAPASHRHVESGLTFPPVRLRSALRGRMLDGGRTAGNA